MKIKWAVVNSGKNKVEGSCFSRTLAREGLSRR